MGDREAKDGGKDEWKQGEARLQWDTSRGGNRKRTPREEKKRNGVPFGRDTNVSWI